MNEISPMDVLDCLKSKMKVYDEEYGRITFYEKKSFGFYLYELSSEMHAKYNSVYESILKLIGRGCIGITVIGFDLKLATAEQLLDYIEIHLQVEY